MEPLTLSTHLLLNGFILTLLVIVALAVVRARDLLASTILFSIFSLLMAVSYLVLQAPDVAITEAAVGAGIGTIIFLATLIFTGRQNDGKRRKRLFPLTVVTLVGLALIYATAGMPALGDANSPANLHIAPYYIQQTYEEMGIPNIVTGVLASYRSFDTMGEVCVVFTALMAVWLLLGNRTEANRRTQLTKSGGKTNA